MRSLSHINSNGMVASVHGHGVDICITHITMHDGHDCTHVQESSTSIQNRSRLYTGLWIYCASVLFFSLEVCVCVFVFVVRYKPHKCILKIHKYILIQLLNKYVVYTDTTIIIASIRSGIIILQMEHKTTRALKSNLSITKSAQYAFVRTHEFILPKCAPLRDACDFKWCINKATDNHYYVISSMC